MNRVTTMTFRALVAFVLLWSCFAVKTQAQTPPAQETKKPAETNADQKKAEEDPFAPAPAPPLPAGMTGADANDPRFKLKAGWDDAGEVSKGLKHLELFKKPDAFQLDTVDPDDAKVKKTLGLMGNDPSKMPKSMRLVMAQLAFANSDIAFQGNHLFQGNFYGMNIFDISDPAKVKLVTSMICPGGQGDVSVYKNLMFMSVEQPNGRIDCGTQGFPPPPPPPRGEREKFPPACSAKGSVPRREDLRYIRHQESEADRRGADLPRIAYPHAGSRSEGQKQRLHLRVRHVVRASG